MGETMEQAVLRMPPALWTGDRIDVMQRHTRYIAAADELLRLRAINVEQKSEIDRLEMIVEKWTTAIPIEDGSGDPVSDPDRAAAYVAKQFDKLERLEKRGWICASCGSEHSYDHAGIHFQRKNGMVSYCCSCEDAAKTEQELRSNNEALVEALKAAKELIRNGIEYGYIQLPDRPDPALETQEKIDAALSRAGQMEPEICVWTWNDEEEAYMVNCVGYKRYHASLPKGGTTCFACLRLIKVVGKDEGRQ